MGGCVPKESHHQIIHKRLWKLKELDASTKIPFILIELRGISNGVGFIEICGKDEYGVYRALDEWLLGTWGAKKLDAGDLSEDTKVPFCDAMYEWNGYKAVGDEGLNNIGLATMRVVDYMAGELGWTLAVVNGGNVGQHGEVREQQVIFKAPHPMNFVSPHIMIELRSAGYIEVCGDDDSANDAMDVLENFFKTKFKARRIAGYEDFCDRYYRTGDGVFLERGTLGDNNLGLLTTQVCDEVVQMLPGWSLVACNGGNYGEGGDHREQELVFRNDNHPLRENPHLLVELRDAGYIEVSGELRGGADHQGIYDKLDEWLATTWGCSRSNDAGRAFCGRKYKWEPRDMMTSTGDVVGFFHHLGWQMQVCSQGTVNVRHSDDSREQQIIVRPGASNEGVVEPHLIIELYMGEKNPDTGEGETEVFVNQHIRMCPIGDCDEAIHKFHEFTVAYLGGTPGKDRYTCDIFMGRGLDNNLGQLTMRVCDFMVDSLGWSFVVCNVCNLGDCGEQREQQLIFRYDGVKRTVPTAQEDMTDIECVWQDTKMPPYWSVLEVQNFTKVQQAIPCEEDELKSLQSMLDATFKRILTRDRVYEYQATTSEEMPYRLEIVHAFRSEHAYLWHRLQKRREAYEGGALDPALEVKTRSPEVTGCLNERLGEGEAYLLHGTNPTSSMNILKRGFMLDAAGSSTGTMFGYGIYLAECSSKSDEYARDDGGSSYPGLMAMLVCRCLVGRCMAVSDPAPESYPDKYIQEAKDGNFDTIIGDREKSVGTYREFIFYDESQVMPEYTVVYRRIYDKNAVDEKFHTRTRGTTGRLWQVQLDTGRFVNVAPQANQELIKASKAGEKTAEVDIAGCTYRFDLENMRQRNLRTGRDRTIRRPMIES